MEGGRPNWSRRANATPATTLAAGAKATAQIDEWAKAVAPSTELRRWYGHDPRRFDEFRRRYLVELAEPERQAALRHLLELARSSPLTLVTATRDLDHSQAAVLAEHLRDAR